MAKSVKSEYFNEESTLQILRAEIAEVKNVLLGFCSKKELPDIMGEILYQQFELYLDALRTEYAGNEKIYHDYLFSRTCNIIAKAFEDLGLIRDAKEIQARARDLSK